MARIEDTPAPDPAVLAEMDEHAETAVTVRKSQGLALGQVTGDVDYDNLRLARLQIAYGVGKLAAKFAPGDLVLGGDSLLVKKGEPLNVIILTADNYWKEYISQQQFQAGIRPRNFATVDEVIKAGGTTEWKDGPDGKRIGPSFSRAMDMKLLIEQPKDIVSGLFGVPVAGKLYAPAIWSVDKSAHRRVEGVVNSAARLSLRTRGLHSAVFQVTTTIELINKNNTPIPNIKLLTHLSDEAVKEIEVLFGRVAAAAAPAEPAEPAQA